MFSNSLAPENLVPAIDQDDADVRPKAFTVEHDYYPLRIKLASFFHKFPMIESSLAAAMRELGVLR